jgi:protocatechuate 3,4-dioxygenase beta subunit
MTRFALTGSALALALAVVLGAGSATAARSVCPASNPPNELLLVGGSGQTVQLGKPFQGNLQVQLANTNGCELTGNLAGISIDFVAPASGASGIFAATGSRIAVVGTDAHGVATAPTFVAGDTAGSYGVDAQSDYGSVKLYLTNTADGLAASIAATGTTSQEATVNGQYAQPLRARVLDANGKPVQGATVSFSIIAGANGAAASFLGGGQATVSTDAAGLATSPPLLANGTPGRFIATAVTGALAVVATYSLDNHAAATSIAAAGTVRAHAAVESRYAQPLEARVLDGSGLPLEGANVTFTISQSGGGASAGFVGGGTQAHALTDANGQATSPPLLANKIAGTFTAVATTNGGTHVAEYTLTNRAGIPHTVTAGSASGESATVGARFPVPLAVTVTDKNGNPVFAAAVVFGAPARGPSGRFTTRRLRSSRTARVFTNEKGIAVAPAFAANANAGGYVVTATVGGVPNRVAFALVNKPRG